VENVAAILTTAIIWPFPIVENKAFVFAPINRCASSCGVVSKSGSLQRIGFYDVIVAATAKLAGPDLSQTTRTMGIQLL
jgi:hypothetical protein